MLRLFTNRYSKDELISLSEIIDRGWLHTVNNCSHNCDECNIKRPCTDVYRLLVYITREAKEKP